MPWYWYRLCGPLVRLYRSYTDEYIQRYGYDASDCPWCGADNGDVYLHKPHFVATGGGEYAPPGEYTVHWCEGWQRCQTCHYRWWVQESD
jgi:hypothetical protein